MSTVIDAIKVAWRHRTKISGALVATNALLTASTIVPAKVGAFAALILGILIIWIGAFNTKSEPPPP